MNRSRRKNWKQDVRKARRYRSRYRRGGSSEGLTLAKIHSDVDQQLCKIGATLDDTTAQVPYDHEDLLPHYKSRHVMPQRLIPSKGSMSLKLLASRKLALNCASLTASHLTVAGWHIWQQVWELILANELDCPRIFKLFLKNFHKAPGFQCHSFIASNTGRTNIQRNMIVKNKGLRLPNYRSETIAWNAMNFPKCLATDSFANLLILDISSLGDLQKSNKNDFYLQLTSLRSLAFLNCDSLTDVDDSICKIWSMALKVGKWPSLRMISLKSTAVTESGIMQLMNVGQNCQLYYIETSLRVSREKSPHWKLIKLSYSSSLTTALKYNYLERNIREEGESSSDLAHIILDYKVIKDPIIISQNDWNQIDTMNDKVSMLWNKRILYNDFGGSRYSYIRDRKLTSNYDHDDKIEKESAKPQKRPVKLRKTMNVKTFFDL